MENQVYQLRTVDEITRAFPGSYVTSDPYDGITMYFYIKREHHNLSSIGILKSRVRKFLGHQVTIERQYDKFVVKRVDDTAAKWIMYYDFLPTFLEIFCKTDPKKRVCCASLATTFE